MTVPPYASARPHMPGYGLLAADEGDGLLPWSWASERLTRAHAYFVATVRPDGRPHVMPVWGVWLDDALYFSTGAESCKARNLAADPRCVVTIDDAREAVVVDGLAAQVHDLQVRSVYEAKYGMAPPDPVFTVRPLIVFGLVEDEDAFAGSATRWTFPGLSTA